MDKKQKLSDEKVTAATENIAKVQLFMHSPHLKNACLDVQIRAQFDILQQLLNERVKKLEEDRCQLEKDKKLSEETSKKLEKNHFSNIVTLNIGKVSVSNDVTGGTLFATSLKILQSDKDSFFAKMFSGSWKLDPLPDGSYFIDR